MAEKQASAEISPSWGWLMVACGAVFYGFQYITRVSPNMMTDELMKTFAIDATELGLLSSLYYAAYALALIPLGMTMDRHGPRFLMALGALLCGSGCLLFSFSDHIGVASFARFIMGLGASSGFLGTLKIGTLWLSPQSLGRVVALTLGIGTAGAVLGGSPLEWLLGEFGWRAAMRLLAAVGLALSVMMVLVIRNRPMAAGQKPNSPKVGLMTVLRSRQAWCASAYGMLMYLPLVVIGDLWGVSFLERLYQIEESVAATVIASLFVGIALGSPTFAFFSDLVRRRKMPMVLSAAACLLCYILILYSEFPLVAMYILFFMAGFFFGGKALGFPTVVDSLPRSISGLAIGFTNTLIMSSGMIGLPLVGFLLDYSRDIPAVHAVDYTLANFRFALTLIPVCLFVSLILTKPVQENYPQE